MISRTSNGWEAKNVEALAAASASTSSQPDLPVVSAQKFVRAHPAFSFKLNFLNFQGSGIRRDDQICRIGAARVRHARAKYFELSFLAAFIPQDCERARPRIKRANLALNHSGWLLPINSAMLAFELRRIRRGGRVLGNSRRRSALEPGKRFLESSGSNCGQPIVK